MNWKDWTVELFSWGLLAVVIWFFLKSLAYAGDVILQWDKNSEPDVIGYKVYARATTDARFRNITSVHTQTSVRVKLDSRRNWVLYVTARNAIQESRSSNNIYLKRGF